MPRRGYQFENQIKKVCEYINSIGGFAHKLCAERTIQGTFIKGEPFDYIVLTKNYKAVFDAKEVKTDKWHMKDKDIRQCNELKKCKNAGIKAYFLIYSDGVVRMIDVDTVIETLKKGSKTISLLGHPNWDLIDFLKEKEE